MPRLIAISLLVFGILGAFFAFNMSIAAPGTSIANLSLMAERQNILLLAAVFFLSGTILFAADHLRGGTLVAQPAKIATSPQISLWSSRAIIGLVVLVCVGLGFYRQSETLSFGPFWVLMIFALLEARIDASVSPIRTTVFILSLAVVALVVTGLFLRDTVPELPAFVSKAQSEAAELEYRFSLDRWMKERVPIAEGNGYALLAVLLGSALLMVVLAGRHMRDRYRKTPPSQERAEPSL